MSRGEQKLAQYLNEAHATGTGIVRELQAQIAMTPRGSYREALELHLGETTMNATNGHNAHNASASSERPLALVTRAWD